MSDLPPLFLERMQRLFGADQAGYDAFQSAYRQPSSAGLRINTLKVSPQAWTGLSPFALQPVEWCPEGFLRAETGAERAGSSPAETSPQAAPGKHPYHQAGLYYLQDVAAMAPVAILNPQPGERILDLAAAPGGKSTQIAARLVHRGLLVSNEIHPKRAWDLAENLERFGVRNDVITQETPERLAEHFGAFFDRVLLDAPCSGEGMFRKSAAARQAWTPDLVTGCSLRQVDILRQAARLVRPGGWLVYVTCTLSPEENETALAAFLSSQDPAGRVYAQSFALVEPLRPPSFAPGRPDWVNSTGLHVPPASDLPGLHLERAVRLWPQRPADSAVPYRDLGLAAGDGHFIALLRRMDGEEAADRAEPAPPPALPREVRQALQHFGRETLAPDCAGEILSGHLLFQGQYIYRLPAAADGQPLHLGGLRVIHPGWWLGQMKKDRFEPAHALALGLSPAEVRQALYLPPSGAQAAAYLRGETLPSPGQDGWVLVCVEPGFALGWGKRTQGVIKNFYPHGLRRS